MSLRVDDNKEWSVLDANQSLFSLPLESSRPEDITFKTQYVKFELEVRDFGCGISKDQLDSLFMTFNTLNEHRQ